MNNEILRFSQSFFDLLERKIGGGVKIKGFKPV